MNTTQATTYIENRIRLQSKIISLEQQLAAEKEKNRWRPMTEKQVLGTLGIEYYCTTNSITGCFMFEVKTFLAEDFSPNTLPLLFNSVSALNGAIFWRPVDRPEAGK